MSVSFHGIQQASKWLEENSGELYYHYLIICTENVIPIIQALYTFLSLEFLAYLK